MHVERAVLGSKQSSRTDPSSGISTGSQRTLVLLNRLHVTLHRDDCAGVEAGRVVLLSRTPEGSHYQQPETNGELDRPRSWPVVLHSSLRCRIQAQIAVDLYIISPSVENARDVFGSSFSDHIVIRYICNCKHI